MTTTSPTPSDVRQEPGTTARPATGRRRGWLRVASIVTFTLLSAVTAGWLGLEWLRPFPYSGTVMKAPTPAPSMDGLSLSDGTPVDIDAFEGDLLLVYFGYTSCPDVCPTTLSQVAAARRRLGDDAGRVHFLMISIDPERDTLDELGDYVEAFDPDFLGATGDPADVDRVAAQYGVFYAKGEALGDGYAVDHTATLMGIDGDGHLRIVWPALLDVERLASDLHQLL